MNEKEQGQEIVNSITMTVTLISFAMLFATLMLGLAMLRFSSAVWPPDGMKPPVLQPVISTIIIFFSSLSYLNFQKKINDKKNLAFTIALGIAFLIAQSFLWKELKMQGIYISSGIFASIMYAFTWIHAAHIVAGLMFLNWLYFFGLKEHNKKTKLRIQSIGRFWHFLGLVWFIMFLTIFIF